MVEKMFSKLGDCLPDNLIAGTEIGILAKEVTLAKGQGVLKRGTVIGILTASLLGKPVDSTKTDGTQTPYGILTDDVDTGDGTSTTDTNATCFVSGLFNSNALVFGGTDTAVTHEKALRDIGIFLKKNIEY